ncbi:MAG: universal stress protein [Actinobacteria bacterium]|nr:universal stress protein [Actinomycetota bacterium]
MTTLPYREIIVGTDGSPTACSAVRAAASLAGMLDLPLSVVTAWYRERDDAPPTSEEAKYPGGNASAHEAHWASKTTSEAAGIARRLGVEDVSQHTPTGNPAEALLELADDRPGALVVVGTVGLAARAERFVGNVPHQLTHHASRDLLLVRPVDDEGPRTWSRVALATDGSSTAAVACEHGYHLAKAIGAAPILFTVAKSEPQGDDVLARAAGQFDDDGDLGQEMALGDDVSAAITEVAPRYDLLVIGNKGMSGPSRLLGSVSNRITHEVPTDLLLVNTSR